MARTRARKFDPSKAITDELIRIIERGVLPWRKPWTAGGARRPLRHNGEPYQGINNFLLTLRTQMAGYASPYWMTFNQAKTLGGSVRKGEKSSLVVYYGQAQKGADADDAQHDDQDDPKANGPTIRFQKSYRVFNCDQIEGLDETYHPKPDPGPEHPPHQPIPHMQEFFEAIDITTVFTGREAYYMPAVDKVYMPELWLFEDPLKFYAVWAHECGHATKAPHRLNRSYGEARFGNTAYSREEIVAELTSVFIGQHLGFSAHTLEMSAAYLQGWIRVLRSDKTAIFKHAADAQRACDYLIAASEAGRAQPVEQAA